MPYTYIVECSDGTYYTGWTVDLEARIADHNAGNGARYTRGRLPVHLVYFEEHETRGEAQRRESFIKGLPRPAKEKLAFELGEGGPHTSKGE